MIKDDLWPNPLQYYLASDIEVEENGVDSDGDDDNDDQIMEDDSVVIVGDDDDDDDEVESDGSYSLSYYAGIPIYVNLKRPANVDLKGNNCNHKIQAALLETGSTHVQGVNIY
jgi:hypothetical protein